MDHFPNYLFNELAVCDKFEKNISNKMFVKCKYAMQNFGVLLKEQVLKI